MPENYCSVGQVAEKRVVRDAEGKWISAKSQQPPTKLPFGFVSPPAIAHPAGSLIAGM